MRRTNKEELLMAVMVVNQTLLESTCVITEFWFFVVSGPDFDEW